MIGQPFPESLLEWCEGDDVADAVESVREKMREEAAVGARGDAGAPTGSHLARTFAKLEIENAKAREEEERAAARSKQLREINAREEAAGRDASARSAARSAAPSAARLPPDATKTTASVGVRPTAHAPSAEERAAATERRRALAAEQAAIDAARDAERERVESEDAAERVARAAADIAAAEACAATDVKLAAESARMRAELEARVSGANADAATVKIMEQRRRLPSWAKSEELLRAVAANQVTIVAGETDAARPRSCLSSSWTTPSREAKARARTSSARSREGSAPRPWRRASPPSAASPWGRRWGPRFDSSRWQARPRESSSSPPASCFVASPRTRCSRG